MSPRCECADATAATPTRAEGRRPIVDAEISRAQILERCWSTRGGGSSGGVSREKGKRSFKAIRPIGSRSFDRSEGKLGAMLGVVGCAGAVGVSPRHFWRRETFTHCTTGTRLESPCVTQQDALACSAAFLAQHGGRAGRWQQQRPASRSAALHPHAVTAAFDCASWFITTGNPNAATNWPSMARLTAAIRMPRATMSIQVGGGRIVIGESGCGDRLVAQIRSDWPGDQRASKRDDMTTPGQSLLFNVASKPKS